jgi:hypothetical protein
MLHARVGRLQWPERDGLTRPMSTTPLRVLHRPERYTLFGQFDATLSNAEVQSSWKIL